MTGENITYHTLDNGLRIVCMTTPDSDVEYAGVAVNAGSRDERAGEYGLAHFVEHTIFKGTARRRAHHIINRMEAVGGELNAYTTKEETYVYSAFPAGYTARATELICDLITGSVFPPHELDREREVVADEIDSYLDVPSEAIYDLFEELIYAGGDLSHPILGTIESLRGFGPDECRQWLCRNYVSRNMIYFYSGPMTLSRLLRAVGRYLTAIHDGDAPDMRADPPVRSRHDERRRLDCHQSHNIIGARIPGMDDPNKYPMALLNNILGGPGMNSRLNVALRERRGLVYSIDSAITHYTDSGVISIYFGCDHDDETRCRDIVMRILDDAASKRMTDRAVEAAARQYIGQLAVASANLESRTLSTARATLFRGRAMTSDEIAAKIKAVTADDILRVAQRIAPPECSSLTFY